MSEERFTISVVDVDEQDNKTFIDFEISDEFHAWFVKTHCPSSRFNKDSFKGWLRRSLRLALVTLEQGKYKTIYSKMNGGAPFGACNPQAGDIIVFFSNGYRTRIVSKVTKRGVEFESLFDGDTYRRACYGEIHEITRARSKGAGSTS